LIKIHKDQIDIGLIVIGYEQQRNFDWNSIKGKGILIAFSLMERLVLWNTK